MLGGFLMPILKLFGFTELQTVIALLSMLYFLCAFFGGLLSGMAKAFGNMDPDIPLVDKISFRIIALGAVMMLFFIFYYHVGIIEKFDASHAVYWTSTMVGGPLFALLGSAICEAVFSKQVKIKKLAWQKHRANERLKAQKKRRAAVRGSLEEDGNREYTKNRAQKRQGDRQDLIHQKTGKKIGPKKAH